MALAKSIAVVILNKRLDELNIKRVRPSQVEFNFYTGELKIQNVLLNENIFEKMDIPLKIVAGTAESVTLRSIWRDLTLTSPFLDIELENAFLYLTNSGNESMERFKFDDYYGLEDFLAEGLRKISNLKLKTAHIRFEPNLGKVKNPIFSDDDGCGVIVDDIKIERKRLPANMDLILENLGSTTTIPRPFTIRHQLRLDGVLLYWKPARHEQLRPYHKKSCLVFEQLRHFAMSYNDKRIRTNFLRLRKPLVVETVISSDGAALNVDSEIHASVELTSNDERGGKKKKTYTISGFSISPAKLCFFFIQIAFNLWIVMWLMELILCYTMLK